MSLLDTLKKNLTPEQLTAVQDALGDDFDYEMVPRSRLNKVIKQRNEARKKLESYEAGNTGDDDDDIDDPDGGSTGGKPAKKKAQGFTQADIDAAVEAERNKGQEAMAALKKEQAVIAKLQQAEFVDPQLVLNAKLIDMDKVTLDANGAITGGLDDQLSSLAESKPYLKGSTGGSQRGTGKKGGGNDFGTVTSKEEFLKLSLDKQIEFKNANPEAFKGFMSE